MYIYSCIYIYIYVHACVSVCTYVGVCVYVCTYKNTITCSVMLAVVGVLAVDVGGDGGLLV